LQTNRHAYSMLAAASATGGERRRTRL
jgi:hypothetical protein